jgi:hypothetical protein
VSHPPAPATPQGSRAEQVLLAAKLALDLLSTPFHLVIFLFTRARHRRALQRALEESAS